MNASPSVLTYAQTRAVIAAHRATALVFEDPQSQQLLDRLRRVAPSNASIVITGETGTGKELAARYVHDESTRSAGPFVAVNCAAFSESLVESELFGHERGAFTGAVSTKAGWFEAAHGGTLFLDEIGDLPLAMQVKLLRVLQEREVVRVGSRQPIPIDVRLIAATNVNLEEAVEAGRFRSDLYYRINVAALRLLPLRERTGDILPLADHFLRLYCSRIGCTSVTFTAEARALLLSYPWPGNIRELENTIHHALLVCHDDVIRPLDLHLAPLQPKGGATLPVITSPFENLLVDLFEQNAPNLFDSLTETIVRSAYRYCKQNQVQTARLLGVSRNILRSQLKHFGLIGTSEAQEVRMEERV